MCIVALFEARARRLRRERERLRDMEEMRLRALEARVFV